MKKLKFGVVGAGRGMNIANYFLMLGCNMISLCDIGLRKDVCGNLPENVSYYRDFYKFIEQDMDFVVLANNFHEHAPFAIECFKRGIHVFSECLSNGTLKDGVELLREFEKYNCIYMLAENYPFMTFNREIKRVCDGGSLGKFIYAEAEYNHPSDPNNINSRKRLFAVKNHWRSFLPKSYYLTHSLAPLMYATGATPKKVTAFACFAPPSEDTPTCSFVGDAFSSVSTLNDDGSIFRVTGNSSVGAAHHSTRVCGKKGQIENLRGSDDSILLRYSPWHKPENMETAESLYKAELTDKDDFFIKQAGHAGGDFLAPRFFLDCLKAKKQPPFPFDVYSAVTMASVAIFAHRSVLNGGMPFDIPDFKLESERKKFENDDSSPFYTFGGKKPTIPCCSHPEYKPSQKQIDDFYKKYI
ncbi:MAG: hypothetical protein E7347_03200 [Clostridiales bacterium]|nr:hypothetical protein [Clostridiales bacterium]